MGNRNSASTRDGRALPCACNTAAPPRSPVLLATGLCRDDASEDRVGERGREPWDWSGSASRAREFPSCRKRAKPRPAGLPPAPDLTHYRPRHTPEKAPPPQPGPLQVRGSGWRAFPAGSTEIYLIICCPGMHPKCNSGEHGGGGRDPQQLCGCTRNTTGSSIIRNVSLRICGPP